MPSNALSVWHTTRTERLDELLAAHGTVGGTGRGRRWRTEELNSALILRLAAEFQGFARDLHDIAADTFAMWASPTNAAVQDAIRNLLRENRQLDRGNAQPSALGSDFGRFGFQLWPALAGRTRRSDVFNQSLERLNTARNGIAHADDAKLAELAADGFPIILATFRRWRGHLDALAGNLDAEVAARLGSLFGQPQPW